jgi:hypothetical protein
MSREFPSVPVVAEVVPLNAGDVEHLLSYWAEDATVTLVGAPFGIRASFCGREQIRAWFSCLVAKHTRVQVKVIKVQSHIVTTRTESRSDCLRQLGMTSLPTTETYLVHGGRITGLTVSVSPKSRIRLQAALQALQTAGGISIDQG